MMKFIKEEEIKTGETGAFILEFIKELKLL